MLETSAEHLLAQMVQADRKYPDIKTFVLETWKGDGKEEHCLLHKGLSPSIFKFERRDFEALRSQNLVQRDFSDRSGERLYIVTPKGKRYILRS